MTNDERKDLTKSSNKWFLSSCLTQTYRVVFVCSRESLLLLTLISEYVDTSESQVTHTEPISEGAI